MENLAANEGWALILGASSGFGGATAVKLASAGMDILGVHLDRRATLGNVESIVQAIKAQGRQAHFFNVNAADPEKRQETLAAIEAIFAGQRGRGRQYVRVLLHSLAFGALKPFVAADAKEGITPAQMAMTLDVMAHSLVYWVQDLAARGLLQRGSRIFAMTSAGGRRVWPTYGAVSAAKAALESHVRQLAFELAPQGITVNAIRAGVTDTPALRKIPGNEKLLEAAQAHNPSGRLTTPEDVAAAIAALVASGTAWLTGNVIGVDGGEDIIG